MITSVTAGKGILTSVIATGLLGFPTVILFLFCTPDLDTALALDAPQPFVQIYALALGKGGSIVMTVIAVIDLLVVCLFHLHEKKSILMVLAFTEYKCCHCCFFQTCICCSP